MIERCVLFFSLQITNVYDYHLSIIGAGRLHPLGKKGKEKNHEDL